MARLDRSYAVPVVRNPIHATLAAFPTVCFTLTLLTDIAYWQTSHLLWQHFSEWLLLVGIVMGVLAALTGLVEHVTLRDNRPPGTAWPHAVGSAVVLVLALLNNLVHAGDGWTSVVPYGLILSALTVIVMIVAEVLDYVLLRRHALGAGRYD